jgi:hypothetical protein
MAYPGNIFQVMIGCPADAEKDLQIILDCISDWNIANSSPRQAAILPLHWRTNLLPQFGKSSQEVINKTLLAEADVLVVLFWNRIGSATREDISGTVEEIKKHSSTGKPTFIYFSLDISEANWVDAAQLESLKSFKKDIRDISTYIEYNNPEELRRVFTRHLTQLFNQLSDATVAPERDAQFAPLTPAAIELLTSAALSAAGRIAWLRSAQGDIFQTTDAHNDPDSQRDTARFVAGLEQLLERELVRRLSDAVYLVTEKGYNLADYIAKNPSL